MMGNNIRAHTTIISGLLLFALFIFTVPPQSSGAGINLGPLLNVTTNEQDGTRDLNALGPLIKFKKTENTTEYGFRPLFYKVADHEKDKTAFDLLYPISTYRRWDKDLKMQLLMYVMYYRSVKQQSGFMEREYIFIPFIFSKKAEEKDDSYFAFFPFYGRVKHKYVKDEINFFMFPFYLQTVKNGMKNTSFIWPFIAVYTGGQQTGGRFWPVYGQRKVGETREDRFVMWPFYMSRERMFYGDKQSTLSVWPFYYGTDAPGRTQRTFFWPFINKIEDKNRDIKRWDVPWPLITVSNQSRETKRFFPFYSKSTGRGADRGFFMWPLYRYDTIELDRYKRKRVSVLLFIYKDINNVPIKEGGRDGRRIDLWPLFSYKRVPGERSYFRLFSPLEMFLANNPPRERNWAPIWRIFEWNKDAEGTEITSVFWRTIVTERSKERVSVDIRPIIPFFSYLKSPEKGNMKLLGGLLGYEREQQKKKLRFLYIPVTISGGKDKKLADNGGG